MAPSAGMSVGTLDHMPITRNVDRSRAQERLLDHYAELARTGGAALHGPQQRPTLRHLRREYANLRWAAGELDAAGETDAGLALLGDLGDFWVMAMHPIEGQRLIGELLTRGVGPAPGRARALITLPRAALTYAGAARHSSGAEEALAYARAVGDELLADEASLCLAIAQGWAGEIERAAPEIIRLQGSPHPQVAGRASNLFAVGLITTGAVEAGRTAMVSAVRHWKQLGDELEESVAWLHYGFAFHRQGAIDDADQALRRCTELAGDDLPAMTLHADYARAMLAAEAGDAGGRSALESLRPRFRAIADFGCLNGCHRHLAEIAVAEGRPDEALDLLRDELDQMPAVDAQEAAASLVQIGEIYVDRGRQVETRLLARAARSLATGAGIGWSKGQWDRLDALDAAVGVTPNADLDDASTAAAVDVSVAEAISVALR